MTAAAAEHENVREAVGVFHDEDSLRSAVDDLLIAGFDRSYLSLLASHKTVEDKLGAKSEKIAEIEDEADVPVNAYAESDSRTEAEGIVIGGAAALIAAAAAGGAGGLIGVALSKLIEDHHARYLQEQLDRGGLLLWVRTPDAEHENRAVDILKRHSADDVHVHELPDAKYEFKGGMSHDMSFMNLLGL
jgi:hypothetical protein